MNAFDQAWNMTTEHHRVSPTVRVTIQTRAVNVYTYVEDFVTGYVIDELVGRWKIRRGTVRAHGAAHLQGPHDSHPRVKAKARAEELWKELKQREFVMSAASAS